MSSLPTAVSERLRLRSEIPEIEKRLEQHLEQAAAIRATQVETDTATLDRLNQLVKEISSFRDVELDALRAPTVDRDLDRVNAPEVLAKLLRSACEQCALIHYGLSHRISYEPRDEIADALSKRLATARENLANTERQIVEAREVARALVLELSSVVEEIKAEGE